MSVPKNLISLAEFLDMKASFDSNIETKLGSNLTKSLWFSFENLEEYLAYVKKEASNNNIEVSGIRIHMVAKTKDTKQLTLALTPTFESNTKHIDFDPVFSETDKPKTLQSLEMDTQKAAGTGAILNRAFPCPPHCPK